MDEQLRVETLVEDLQCADMAAEVLGTDESARAAAQLAVQTSMMERSW